MIITDENIEYIETTLSFYGITDTILKEDLLDHICTHIENSTCEDFETAYMESIEKLGGYAIMQIIQKEKDDKFLIKTFIKRKKNVYLTVAINAIILLIGFLFLIFKWPFSGVLILIGFSQLILITIPFILYEQFKLKAQKLILTNK